MQNGRQCASPSQPGEGQIEDEDAGLEVCRDLLQRSPLGDLADGKRLLESATPAPAALGHAAGDDHGGLSGPCPVDSLMSGQPVAHGFSLDFGHSALGGP